MERAASVVNRVGRWIPSALLALSALALAEGASWAAFTFVLQHRGLLQRDLDAVAATVTAEGLARFGSTYYDREIGWRYPPGSHATRTGPSGRKWSFHVDDRGARLNPYSADAVRISVYGDSFAFGDDVDDNETWAFFLSELTGTRVDNWGISGGATDQALIRLRRNLPRERTDVVVFTIQSENARRILNSYRPFYTGQPKMPFAFKPMLTLVQGEPIWLPNPLQGTESLEDYERALARARQTDYWYAENQRRPRAQFPYTISLARAIHWAVTRPAKWSAYAFPPAMACMDHLLLELLALSEEYHFVPIVLFIPEPRELEHFASSGSYEYREYVTSVRQRPAFAGLRVVDLLEHQFDCQRFNVVPFRHHPTPYGNHVIADVLYDAIRPILTRRGVASPAPAASADETNSERQTAARRLP